MPGSPRILVTGANGQLGMELRELVSRYPEYDFIFLSRSELAIENKQAVKHFFDKENPSFCINCAAYTAVDKAETEKEQAFLINAEAVGVLAAECKNHDTQFVHISTDYVFDGMAETPYKEDSPVKPQSVYGESKLEGERLAIQNDPSSIIIRTSWVYSEFGKNFVKTMLKLMSERETLNVVSDQIGSPTYAADLADTILQIITRLPTPDSRLLIKQGIFHYSNDGIISWYEFARAIKELSGSRCMVNPIPTSQYPTPAKRPAYSVLDKKKIHKTFDIELQNWRQSLEACIQRINSVTK